MTNFCKFSAQILFLITLCNCTSPKPAPDAAAPPPNPYADLEKKIAAIQEDSDMPALHVQVYERSEVKFDYVKGVRSLSFPTPVQPKDKFPIGSASKAITAILVAEMVEFKQVNWDTPLKNLIRDLPMHNSHRETTIAMLLGQTSGMMDVKDLQGKKLWPQLLDMKSTKDARTRAVRAILAAPPRFTPGTKADVGISAYMVLSWILQNKTNFSWEELVKNKIFLHLNMDNCSYGPNLAESPEPVEPWGHMANKEGKLEPVKPSGRSGYPAALIPVGGIYCGIEDWNKFVNMVSQGFYRESTFLKEETFAELLTNINETPYTKSAFTRYERTWASGTALAISGSHPNFFMMTASAPGREMVFTVYTNSSSKKAEQGAAKIIQLLTEMK